MWVSDSDSLYSRNMHFLTDYPSQSTFKRFTLTLYMIT